MSLAGAPLDPHDKMRARDVNKVACGEQAPRPAHEFGTVSPPLPPSSTGHIDANKKNSSKGEKQGTAENSGKLAPSDYQMRHCYVKYVEYHRCIKQNGEEAPECEKLGTDCRSSCPTEWIVEWDREREGEVP